MARDWHSSGEEAAPRPGRDKGEKEHALTFEPPVGQQLAIIGAIDSSKKHAPLDKRVGARTRRQDLGDAGAKTVECQKQGRGDLHGHGEDWLARPPDGEWSIADEVVERFHTTAEVAKPGATTTATSEVTRHVTRVAEAEAILSKSSGMDGAPRHARHARGHADAGLRQKRGCHA